MIGVRRLAAASAVLTVLCLLMVGVCLRPQRADAQALPDANGGPDRLQELQDAVAAMQASAVDHQSLAYRTNFPYAELQLRKARLARGKTWYFGDTSSARCIQEGLKALDRITHDEPLTATKGVLSELAYITDNDGTAQPYYLHLPSNYDPAKKWPLIVFLHGYVGSISILDPWVLSEEVCQVAEDNGCALLIPYGRRNTDFQGVGEVDVLASTAQVLSLYSIDPDRVYMSGVSMGGMGAWNMALRHPGMYAATTPMSGQTDMHVWWPRALPGWPASRDDIPPFRRMLVEWDNPIDLVMNARNQPMFVQHGEMDALIPVEQSRSMVAAAGALGIPIKYGEFAGASHYIYFELPCFQNAWGWEKAYTLNHGPQRVTYKTFSLHYDRAFWATIADFVEWGKPATVDCRVTADGAGLTVNTENVRLLKVDVKQAPLKKVEDFTVTVNGRRTTARATANWDLYIVCDPKAPTEQTWPPHKRNGLCGPVEDVFNTRFLLVQGTSGDAVQTEANGLTAARWATEWDQFADGLPPMKADKDVTAEDIASSNLVLFGTPATNSILARIADKLPIQIGEQKYTVAGKTYQGDDLGLVLCYPNPLAPDHYVLIYSGILYGEKCGINHKHDLVPDFIVFNNHTFNYDDTNQHEVAGYFGMDWDLNPKTTYVRVP
jgi:poly(3-hydroxybutyrate) depolymerase